MYLLYPTDLHEFIGQVRMMFFFYLNIMKGNSTLQLSFNPSPFGKMTLFLSLKSLSFLFCFVLFMGTLRIWTNLGY